MTVDWNDGTEAVVMSRGSLALYAAAAEATVWLGQPGYICDIFLATVELDTTTGALELELEGVWERCGKGYRFLEGSSRRSTQSLI